MWEILCTWWPWAWQHKNFHKKIIASPIYSELIWCPSSRHHALSMAMASEKRLWKNMDLIQHLSGSDRCWIQVPFCLDRLFFFSNLGPPLLIPIWYDVRNTLHLMAMDVAAQKLSQEDEGQSDLFRIDMMHKIKIPCTQHGHGIWKKTLNKYGLDSAPVWIRQVLNPSPYF